MGTVDASILSLDGTVVASAASIVTAVAAGAAATSTTVGVEAAQTRTTIQDLKTSLDLLLAEFRLFSRYHQSNVPNVAGTVVYYSVQNNDAISLTTLTFTIRSTPAMADGYLMVFEPYSVTLNGINQVLRLSLLTDQPDSTRSVGPLPWRGLATTTSSGSFNMNVYRYVLP